MNRGIDSFRIIILITFSSRLQLEALVSYINCTLARDSDLDYLPIKPPQRLYQAQKNGVLFWWVNETIFWMCGNKGSPSTLSVPLYIGLSMARAEIK